MKQFVIGIVAAFLFSGFSTNEACANAAQQAEQRRQQSNAAQQMSGVMTPDIMTTVDKVMQSQGWSAVGTWYASGGGLICHYETTNTSWWNTSKKWIILAWNGRIISNDNEVVGRWWNPETHQPEVIFGK